MKYTILVFCILCNFSIFSQTNIIGPPYNEPDKKDACDLNKFQQPNTSITFYGDSRGDLVNMIGYGEFEKFGWIPYLNLGSIQDWNVQNLAQAGDVIAGMYSKIINCVENEPKRPSSDPNYKGQYLIANRIAFEIGGNDALAGQVPIYFAPYVAPEIADAIYKKQRGITELVILLLESKGFTREHAARNVLMMGSYPAISRGYKSGAPADGCFRVGLNSCIPSLNAAAFPQNQWYNFFQRPWSRYKDNLSTDQMIVYGLSNDFKLFLEGLLRLVTFYDVFTALEEMIKNWDTTTKLFLFDPSKSSIQLWREFTFKGNSGATIASMLMAGMSQTEEAMAKEKGINYIHLYIPMINPEDCNQSTNTYSCWAANPKLYTDPIHPNWMGYSLIGTAVGKWMGDNGWHIADGPPSVPDKTLINLYINAREAIYNKGIKIKLKIKQDDVMPDEYISVNGIKGYCQEFQSPFDILGLDKVTVCYSLGASEAYETHGSIRAHWLKNGSFAWLGFPTSDEKPWFNVDRCSNFENGHIYWRWTGYIERNHDGVCADP